MLDATTTWHWARRSPQFPAQSLVGPPPTAPDGPASSRARRHCLPSGEHADHIVRCRTSQPREVMLTASSHRSQTRLLKEILDPRSSSCSSSTGKATHWPGAQIPDRAGLTSGPAFACGSFVLSRRRDVPRDRRAGRAALRKGLTRSSHGRGLLGPGEAMRLRCAFSLSSCYAVLPCTLVIALLVEDLCTRGSRHGKVMHLASDPLISHRLDIFR